MNLKLTFPVNSQPHWCAADTLRVPDPVLKNWLLDTGSLTERLQAQCRHFSVHLLGQKTMPVSAEEQHRLGLLTSSAMVREVVLLGDGCPWVFARSILPVPLCSASDNEFSHLGNQPLGKILFNDTRFVRQPFELGKLTADSTLHQGFREPPSTALWGRRSVFLFQSQQLSVAEIFLPASPAYRQYQDEASCG